MSKKANNQVRYAQIVIETLESASEELVKGMRAPLGTKEEEGHILKALRTMAIAVEEKLGLYEHHISAFSASLESLGAESKQADHSRGARDRAEQDFQLVIINTARMLEGALRLAGLDYEADRIRPSYSRANVEETVELSGKGRGRQRGADLPRMSAGT